MNHIPLNPAQPGALGASELINCTRNLQAALDQLRRIASKMPEMFEATDASAIATYYGGPVGSGQALNDKTTGLYDKLIEANTGLLSYLATVG